MRFVWVALLIGCGGAGKNPLSQRFAGDCTTASTSVEIETSKLESSDAQDWKGALGDYETLIGVAQLSGGAAPEEVDMVIRRCIDPGGCSTGTTDYVIDQVNILLHVQGMERLQAWPMFDIEVGVMEGACFYQGEAGDLLLERS